MFKLNLEKAEEAEIKLPTFVGSQSLAKKELNWEAKFGIEEMCADSWNWQSKNPNGYNE